ncbi:MAG: hypothetical protein NTV24_00775 [Candidatus Woesebacteria bacterium]|nr:hypothetical protein [Candidatus Woesebacteria bacterium]
MKDPGLVNIGTKESPVLVSKDAVSKTPDKEQRFWSGVASGSTMPSSDSQTDQQALDLLLKKK